MEEVEVGLIFLVEMVVKVEMVVEVEKELLLHFIHLFKEFFHQLQFLLFC